VNSLVRYLGSFLFPRKIEVRKSEVSGSLEVNYSNGKYVLDSASVNYSFGGLHEIFRKAFDQFNIRDKHYKRALILGFGSGSVASILQDEYGMDVSVTGVEKDKEVIELGKKYFNIDKYKNLSLEYADAYDFMLSSSFVPFDLVVMDVFVDLRVPEKFLEDQFLSALSNCLPEGGILFYNFIARDEITRDRGAKLFKQLNQLVGNTEWVRLFAKSTENWVFVSRK